MKKTFFSATVIVLFIFLVGATPLFAQSLSERLSGLILLQVQERGEGWYVYPDNLTRYYLDRPDDAFEIMRSLGLGITNADLESLLGEVPNPDPTDGEQIYATVNQGLAQRLSGYILLQVEGTGEAYYIYPDDLRAYYLGRPADAFRVMSDLGLGITNVDLEQIPAAIPYGDDGLDGSTQEVEEEVQQLTADFEPPTGIGIGPSSNGPWMTRLLSARSDDGLTWEKTGDIISDQADVPDLAIVDGLVYLYYTAWTAGNKKNTTVVALSYDDGQTWIHKFIDVNGFEGLISPVDPDIAYVNNVFRLFLTSDPNDGDGPRSYWAESDDGLSFTHGGVAFASAGENVLDPNTILINDTWHYFAGGAPGGNWHATSDDGKEFTYYASEEFREGNLTHMMSNGIEMDGVYRYWAFSNDDTDIYSFTTEDGYDWEYEGMALEYDASSGLENDKVRDATVIQLDDGSYLMVYVAGIPE
jgi:hypothetical protein